MSETHGRRLRAGRRAAVLGGRQAAADWAGRTGDFLSSIYDWVAARIGEEADTARLAPWLAVGFGMGILLYFAAPSEPSLYAPAIVLLLFSGNA